MKVRQPQSATSTTNIGITPSLEQAVRELLAKHGSSAFVSLNPFYSLPPDLLESLETESPGFLTSDEIFFEEDLHALCQQHHAIGVFHDRPIYDPALTMPAMPNIFSDDFEEFGWTQFGTLNQLNAAIELGGERLDPLRQRLDAYRGWLVTNPQYLKDRDELKNRWEAAINQIGYIPRYCLEAAQDLKVRKHRRGADVTDAFFRDFNTFFEKWDLLGLLTWDLPEPRGPNLSGHPFPASVTRSSTTAVYQLPRSASLPANYPLGEMIREFQRANSPAHLQEWLAVCDQLHKKDLGFRRLGRIFVLDFYRDKVLASRYGDRFVGNVGALDEAFGQFLDDLGSDSVKKLRGQINERLHAPS